MPATPEHTSADIIAAELTRVATEVRSPLYDVRREGSDLLKVSTAGGSEWIYVTVSDEPPRESRELTELEEMDELLKADLFGPHTDAKLRRELVGERRQLQKQMTALRASLNSANPSEAKGKLDALKDKQW